MEADKITNVLKLIFGTLPSRIKDLYLSVRFVSPENIVVHYTDDLGNSRAVYEIDLNERFNPTLMVVELAYEFCEEDVKQACEKDDFLVEKHWQDFDRIGRDILLIFDTLPPLLHSTKESGGKVKLGGKGKPFDLRVDVNASVERPSWLVQYVFTDTDALTVSFAVDGKDDEVSYWHEHELTKKDLVWGMKHNFDLSISGVAHRPDRPTFQVVFLDPTPEHNRQQSWMAQSLDISVERSKTLIDMMNHHRNKIDMDQDRRFNKAYERVTAECANANELFFIGWACGMGL